jgi:chromosomal replication initiation ATPase DnaA
VADEYAGHDANAWSAVLARLETELDGEDFRRWFGATAYASDSGDQITVWVPSEPIRRHITSHFHDSIVRALAASGRTDVHIRYVVAGFDEDESEAAT